MAYRGSDAEKQAVRRYQQNRDNIMIRPDKETGAQIRQAAAQAGKSVQAFILDILMETIVKDQKEG